MPTEGAAAPRWNALRRFIAWVPPAIEILARIGGGLASGYERAGAALRWRGERPGPGWHGHGWLPRKLTVFDGAALRSVRVYCKVPLISTGGVPRDATGGVARHSHPPRWYASACPRQGQAGNRRYRALDPVPRSPGAAFRAGMAGRELGAMCGISGT